MDISFESIINTIFFVGAAQGFILTFFLFNVKSNRLSNRLLGILTSLWAIILLVFALQSYGLYFNYPHLLRTFYSLLFLWFPLLYLSIKYLISSHKRFEKADWLHFIPMVVSILLYTKFYFKSGAEKIEIIRLDHGYYYIITLIGDEVLAIQGVIYSILSLIILNNYSRKVVDYHANVDRTILKGLKTGVVLSLIAWSLGIIGSVLERAQMDIGIDLFLFVYLFFVIIIYVISIIAIRSPEVYKLREDQVTDLLIPSIKEKKKVEIKTPEKANKKKNELRRKEELFESELNDRLIEFMNTSKPYLNPDFSLQALSSDLEVSRHQLSSTINTKQKMNFYEFINSYRVQEVKKLMMDPENKNQNNYELAFAAGFNSKATFYRIFKQLTNQTPSDYRTSLINN